MGEFSEFIKGADISTLHELESLGAVYRVSGLETDLIDALRLYGFNAVRLKIWNDPFSEDGEIYGAGGNDLAVTLSLAGRAVKKNMKLLLNFHYSDFWADPAKQTMPKAWRGFSDSQLEQAVHDYTADVLTALKDIGAAPSMVQIGNEITNGLLWPNGRVPNYDAIARFVSAGIRAVRETVPSAHVMLHLDQGGKNRMYREWFDHFTEKGEDFDVMGLSYYPFWHGSLDDLEFNMNDMAERYGKQINVVETSMGFTTEDYAGYEGLAPHERKGMATKPELVAKVPYPMTSEGQGEFMRDLIGRIRRVGNGKGGGFFYWEPGWIPVKGSQWANEAALSYTGETGPGGNEWANQALFDYDGNALPALEVIRDC